MDLEDYLKANEIKPCTPNAVLFSSLPRFDPQKEVFHLKLKHFRKRANTNL